MSKSSSSSFKDLFNAALQDYENKTGINLVDNPLAKKLENCDSVDFITAIFQEQTQIFRKFRDDGKLIKSLKSSVDILYMLSDTVLGGGIGLVHPHLPYGFFVPYRHFTGIPACECNIRWHLHPTYRMSFSDPSSYLPDIYVPQVVKDMSSSYDTLVDLLASFENFLSRLSIYIGVPSTPALKNVLVKILVELLSTLALVTKQVKQGRFSESVLAGKTLN